ncbi:MAG: hypothetical protein FWG52_07045, partial [Proteobacteria bacterium]|nr:hypothetical protein [Pseudomonadota bacterium]
MMVMPSRRNEATCSISSLFDFISLSPDMPRVPGKTRGTLLNSFSGGLSAPVRLFPPPAIDFSR